MKIAGLFSGVGGFEAGLAASGCHAALMCEIWPPARAVLRARFPHIPLAGDIVDLSNLPGETEAIIAGFPCQDLSQAGATAGIAGPRSGLVQHVFRLMDRQRPRWVALENVSFMLQLDRGRAMRLLVDAFEERGYRWAYRVVNSLAFVPQRRERVVFLASSGEGEPADVLFSDEAEPPSLDPRLEGALRSHAHGFYWTEGVRGLGWATDAIPPLKNGSTLGIPSPPAILLPDGRIVTPDIRDAERLQGFGPGWTEPASSIGRASFRWSLVGNAVTQPLAQWLGSRLLTPGAYDRTRDQDLTIEARWPSSARFDGEIRRSVRINAFPVRAPRPPLADFLQWPGKPLSVRATRGFLARTERSRLQFPPGFIDAVRAHLAHIERNQDGSQSPLAAE